MERKESERCVFNRTQAASFAGVSAPTIDEWLRRDGFPAFRSGRRWIIPKDAFVAWLNEQAAKRAQL